MLASQSKSIPGGRMGDEPNLEWVSQKMRKIDHLGDFPCRDTQKELGEGVGVSSFFEVWFHQTELSTDDRYLLNSMLNT